jgi:hypothetical protein
MKVAAPNRVIRSKCSEGSIVPNHYDSFYPDITSMARGQLLSLVPSIAYNVGTSPNSFCDRVTSVCNFRLYQTAVAEKFKAIDIRFGQT